ncbi:hypothetical protein LF845_08310 [Deferribacterales bacterium Es71-Z0220]|jgi:hypothetical protein|uniref:hypothetical protein n=1 Tax=Deferrivibrio essentukiensis TaxID=2880922 RepID=UPI001F610FD6|nr:hypothetical protein [Deferrivibrio essentukiensis]MCB4204961.1 hypothetical protein [Deferrivibrio essentukiensis]
MITLEPYFKGKLISSILIIISVIYGVAFMIKPFDNVLLKIIFFIANFIVYSFALSNAAIRLKQAIEYFKINN